MSSGAVSASTARQAMQPRPVWVRHVQLRFGSQAQPNETLVRGKPYYPSMWEAVNGRRGYHQATCNPRLNDEGDFAIAFPNAAGDDGVLHRNRFQCIQKGKRIPQPGGTVLTMAGGNYRPGDEWLEVWEGEPPGDLLYVGTPTKYSINLQQLQLQGADALFTLKKQRETAAGFWYHAPRDVFEYYCGAWQDVVAEDFNPGPVINNPTDSDVVTSDGRLTSRYAVSGSGAAQLQTTAAHTLSNVRTNIKVPVGLQAAAPARHQATRFETRFTYNAPGDIVAVLLWDEVANQGVYIWVAADGTVQLSTQPGFAGLIASTYPGALPAGTHTAAIELRGRWCYYYMDGTMVGCLAAPNAALQCRGWVQQQWGNGATGVTAVDYMVLRQTKQYLLTGNDPGDYRLPGAPPPGGLTAAYYTDRDLLAMHGTSYNDGSVLNPTRVPYARRIEQPNNPGLTAYLPAPQPGGNSYWSVRYTGAIYLDLDANDRYLRVDGPVAADARMRLYVGKSRLGEEYATVGGVAGASLRGIFGSNPGWYPVVLEFVQGSVGSVLQLKWATSSGGAYALVPVANLAPIGCYEKQVRYESHYDQLQALAQAFGYQYTCVPKSLESGQFPGLVVPRIRVGRDTEKVLTVAEGTQLQADVTAEEVADDYVGDAQGLADVAGVTQVQAEVYNFPELEQHLLTYTEYESVPDVPLQALLVQRLRSLLALRGSSWEQVGVQPRGYRELLDAFPLTGSLAEFAWGVGDGVRVYVPEIAIEDTSPRQIMGVQLACTPDGKQPPVVQFRQRPRNLEGFIRDMRRQLLNGDRYYQRQLVKYTSSWANYPISGASDGAARLLLPASYQQIVKAELVVYLKSDISAYSMGINGTSRVNVTLSGRYDVTQWAQTSDTSTPGQMYASVVTAGTGSLQFFLELTVVV